MLENFGGRGAWGASAHTDQDPSQQVQSTRTKTVCVVLVFTVGSPPSVIKPLTDTLVMASEVAKLKCEISRGDPAAKITW